MVGAEGGSKLRRLWSREDEWESDDPDDKMGALMMNSRTYAASGCGINHPSVVFFDCWRPFGSFKVILSQDTSPPVKFYAVRLVKARCVSWRLRRAVRAMELCVSREAVVNQFKFYCA